MSIYSEICLDDSSSLSFDIYDSSEIKSDLINPNIKFTKTFYLACKITNKYELIIISIKKIDNCIYIYKVVNNSTTLVKTVDLPDIYNTGNRDNDKKNNILLYNLIKVSSDWTTISIPTGHHMMLCNTKSIIAEDIDFIKIPFEPNIIQEATKFTIYVHSDNIVILYQKDNNIFLYSSYDINHTVNIVNIFDIIEEKNYDLFYFSENGKYISYWSEIENKMCVYSIFTKVKTIINLDIHKIFSKKWLISDDGKLLFNRGDKSLIIISRFGQLDITDKFKLDNCQLNQKSNLFMLKTFTLYSNIETYTIVLWNRVSRYYTLIGIIENQQENKQYATNMYRINYTIPKDNIKSSIHTNGNIYIYKTPESTTINDIRIFFHIPIIRYICTDILTKYEFDKNTDILGVNLTLGNMCKIPKEYPITKNLCKIFTPLHENSRFVIDTYNTIYLDILDNGKKKLDVISVVLYMLEDLQNIDILFETLKKDRHYLSKTYLIFEYMKDIYDYICGYNTKDPLI